MASWVEWDGQGIDGNFVFVDDAWREDSPSERALLAHSLRAIGVTDNSANAHKLAESVEFHLSWYGYLAGELFPDVCDERGYTKDGSKVETPPQKCTFAVLASASVSA